MPDYPLPPQAFLRNCRKNRKKLILADSLGAKLTGGDALLRTLVLRRLLNREVLAADEKYVGVLIPPTVPGVLVNAALAIDSRIAVNLNYTLSKKELDHCLRECGIRHVLTSRKVMEKLNLDVAAELVYLDDFKDKVRLSDKLAAFFQARLMPRGLLERWLGLHKIQPDDVLTIIFTSGSTNLPKGVMLTQRNVGSNVHSVDAAVHIRENDVLLGVVPLFHSIGYTITIWCVLMLGMTGVYHTSPLDAKIIGKLCQEFGGTLLVATPTFLRGYLKRCAAEEFASLDIVVAGAEKMPRDLAEAFEKKFGIRPVEGYGTTELSPLVSVNIPAHRTASGESLVREGSVGRTIPDVDVKVVHAETGADVPRGEEGLLLVHGPNVMKGYLNQPEKTAEVLNDGWYRTGDMARVDDDGYIYITGRLSRFSKIGGEMVPHLKVEEEIHRALTDDEEQLCVAVSSVPDEQKGERLVVFHLATDKKPDEIRRKLQAAGLPNLFIPAADSFCEVAEIPVLGTGKLDLKRLKELAAERFGS